MWTPARRENGRREACRRAGPRLGWWRSVTVAWPGSQPVVSHLLPLSEAAQAHRILEGKHAGGKVVFTVPG